MPFDAAVVARHAGAIEAAPWFAATGLPFSDDERGALEELAPRIARVAGWEQARAVADDVRANAAYDADAREAAALKAQAGAAAGTDTVLRALSTIVDAGLPVFFRCAEAALARAGLQDEELSRVAAGAAAEAVYRGALAAAVAKPTHRFVRIETSYASGRWPLARIDDTLYVL
jgi:hypothetical protein